jgi:hypothetical protein
MEPDFGDDALDVLRSTSENAEGPRWGGWPTRYRDSNATIQTVGGAASTSTATK